ncbi:hypothetical protein AAY473_040345 [Plecturocebus cupreus]
MRWLWQGPWHHGVSRLCSLDSCSAPGEERAICRMLEAGACGATTHLNALCGSDGGCRVPRGRRVADCHLGSEMVPPKRTRCLGLHR